MIIEPEPSADENSEANKENCTPRGLQDELNALRQCLKVKRTRTVWSNKPAKSLSIVEWQEQQRALKKKERESRNKSRRLMESFKAQESAHFKYKQKELAREATKVEKDALKEAKEKGKGDAIVDSQAERISIVSKRLINALLPFSNKRTSTCMQQHQEAVHSLIEEARNILREGEIQDDIIGNCLLHSICSSKHAPIELIQLILDQKQYEKLIFEKDKNGRLPLHIALYNDAPTEVIQLLLQYDDNNKTVYEKDNCSFLPLHIACKTNNADNVQLLMKHDTEKKTLFEQEPSYGMLPLHIACRKNDISIDVVQHLLENDVDKISILSKDRYDSLPLHFACENNASIELIELLLHYDIEHKSIFQKESSSGMLPLHVACRNDDASIEVLQLLLDHDIEKASIFTKDRYDRLPLHLACEKNSSIEVIQLLLLYDIKKKTILEKAELICRRHLTSIDGFHSDEQGSTRDLLPLQIAFDKNAPVKVIRFLLYCHAITGIKHNYDIPFYHLKINGFLDTLTIYKNNIDFHINLSENFVSYCNWVEITTTLELAVRKNNCLYGIEVIMKRVLDFLNCEGPPVISNTEKEDDDVFLIKN